MSQNITSTISQSSVTSQTDMFDNMSVSHSVLSLVPFAMAIEYFAIPYKIDEHNRLEMLMAYPHDATGLQTLQMVSGHLIKPVPVERERLLQLIKKQYGETQKAKGASTSDAQSAPAVSRRLIYNPHNTTTVVVDDILHEAIRLNASDIHLEPFEREMCVRFRIDGVLQEIMHIPAVKMPEVISRVKVMSNMDIAEKRRSQDGKIRLNGNGQDVDIRVSTMPTDFGEKIVLRLLNKSGYDYSLDSVGMDPKRLALFKKAIQMPNGIVLLTGPTGSGKTTTLYGAINFLKKPDINISTIEDPIEYNIPGISQTQIKPAIDLTFASVLRTLLRQDPDVIMVGEMRDQETAEIAIRSSLTGHLVLSTLHTNDAPSAATRLVDMGIEPYLVSQAVSMIVAQRLVRKNCTHCVCEEIVPEEIRKNLGLSPDVKLYKGLGCSACGFTGYKGRTGIFEVMPVTESIKKRIKENADTSDIRTQAIEEGLVTLRENALAKLITGESSLEEILREISVIA